MMITLANKVILKQINPDFRVNEISVLPSDLTDDDSLPVALITITKSGYTTFEAMRLIASILNTTTDTIHCEGLKDEDGITEQILSIRTKDLRKHDVNEINQQLNTAQDKWLRIAIKGYSHQHVQEKSLHGNVFTVTLRNLTLRDAESLSNSCAGADDKIFINYYDQQRFGLPEGPFLAHKIGESIKNSEWDKANELYLESGNALLDGIDKDDSEALKKIHPGKLRFFLSAYSSQLWNEQVSLVVGEGPLLEVFPGHSLTLPANIERAALPLIVESDTYKLTKSGGIEKDKKTRAAFVSTTIYCDTPRPDNLHSNRFCLELTFALPPGSFATMVIKQLCLRALT